MQSSSIIHGMGITTTLVPTFETNTHKANKA